MKVMKPKRTFILWILIGSLMLWSLLGWLRMAETIEIWNLLTFTTPQPEYLLFSALSWGMVGLVFAFALLFRLRWARFASLAVLGLVLWYWVERIALTRSGTAWTNSLFAAGLSLLWVAYAFWVVSYTKRQGYFNKSRTVG
jgi:hypothetical protein